MLLPLSFVVLVSMIKDIFEDLKRHKSDNIENNKHTTQGYQYGPEIIKFEKTKWKDVEVGRILKVH